ncbi:MAG: hypothetical protein ACK5TK_14270 [Betaproteobacteria bacterium]
MSADDDHRTPTSGAAYGPAFRALASAVTFGLLGYGAWLIAFEVPGPISGNGWTLIGACALMMLANWYLMLRAATTVDGQGVRQTGLVERRVAWDDVWYARMGGFAFSRRLVVRTINGRIRYFFGGTPQLHAAFARVAARYPKPRR